MSAQRGGSGPEPEAPNKRKMFPSLLVAIGASGAVVAAGAIGVVLMVGALSFDVWPQAGSPPGGATREVRAPAISPHGPGAGPSSAPAPAAIASSGVAAGDSVAKDSDRPAPKLGKAGLGSAPAPPPSAKAPGEGEGDAGSPGSSGIADAGNGLGDVGLPIHEPTDPRDAELSDDKGNAD